MKLTIVLVTQPARLQYFPHALEAIAQALEIHSDLELLVIFNGKSEEGERNLRPLQEVFTTRVSSEIIEINTPMPDEIVKTIRKRELRWIHIPGDDDLVISTAYSAFFDLIVDSSKYVALGFSANAIDSEGTPTGKFVRPLDFNDVRIEKVLVAALHRPLFVWPSLIFDASNIPEKIFSSRFVFDWWVGIQLSLSGPIATVKQPLVRYRVHEDQESFHVSEMRKRFEAEIMLQSVLMENDFWSKLDSPNVLSLFLDELGKNPPIYGDPRYGASIYCLVLNKFPAAPQIQSLSLQSFMSSFASSKNAFLRMDEFPSKIGLASYFNQQLNFRAEVSPDICKKVADSLERVLNRIGPTIGNVGCSHSAKSSLIRENSVKIDCNIIDTSEVGEIDNLVMRQLVTKLGQDLQDQSQLSPWEKALIFMARNVLRHLRRVRYMVTFWRHF